MTGLAFALSAALAALAVLHAYWGLGGVWPGQDGASAARAVVGRRGIKAIPPPAACFIVALVLAGLACWPVAATARLWFAVPPLLLTMTGVLIALVFFARGFAAYLPAWRRLSPEMPFARLDRQVYGPLCLLLGLGFTALLWNGSTA